MPEAGQVVGGRYRLVRPLGEGGMASVWAAEHMTMGNLLAIKIISPELLQYPVAIARFNREARAAAKLRSPYVVQMFDHDVDPVLGPFIAMEVLEGESLSERLDRERTLPPQELSRIMLQVGKGLMRAHAAGIVHRDIKPENIFLTVDEDDGEIAKILDFGVAKADSPLNIKEGGKTVAGTLLGTLNYMSPEQAQGREVNHLTDLWALGVIAFEALVGRRPFDEEAPGALIMQICGHPMPVPSRVNAGVPPEFDTFFAKACNRDPSRRFQSSQELSLALADVCEVERLSLSDIMISALPAYRPISSDGMGAAGRDVVSSLQLRAAPVGQAPIDPMDGAPESASGRKRRVLQIVESIPPPALPESEVQLIPSDPPDDIPIEIESDPEYYVTNGTATVGPVTIETLRQGWEAGNVVAEAQVWAHSWSSWRPVADVLSVFPEKPKRRASRDGLLSLGPIAAPPAGAPPPPVRSLVAATLPAPVTAVRPSPGKKRTQEPMYYVVHGAVSVGPVRASVLRRGLQDNKVPKTALLWRTGWHEWKTADLAAKELEAWEPAPADLLNDLPGLEAVGMRSRPPPTAPPTITPNRRGQSK
jgi:serine/threonine-protein kinase